MMTRACRIVVVESPYKATSKAALERNLAYARALVQHVTMRGDSPTASHLSITQSLDDRSPAAREAGIAAGLAILRVADIHLFGVDLGWSDGMQRAKRATPPRCSVEEISLPEWHEAVHDERLLAELVAKYQPLWHAHE